MLIVDMIKGTLNWNVVLVTGLNIVFCFIELFNWICIYFMCHGCTCCYLLSPLHSFIFGWGAPLENLISCADLARELRKHTGPDVRYKILHSKINCGLSSLLSTLNTKHELTNSLVINIRMKINLLWHLQIFSIFSLQTWAKRVRVDTVVLSYCGFIFNINSEFLIISSSLIFVKLRQGPGARDGHWRSF